MQIFMPKVKIFRYSMLAFIAGIGAAAFLPEKIIDYKLVFFSGMAGILVVIFLLWRSFKEDKLKKYRLFLLLILLFSFLLGLWRYTLSIPQKAPDKVWYYNEKKVVLSGYVVEEPEKKENNVKLKVKSEKLKVKREQEADVKEKKVEGMILAAVNLYPAYNYGDELELECKLKTPEPIEDFDYDRYLARYDIYSLCYYPKIISLKEGKLKEQSAKAKIKYYFYSSIYKIRNKLSENIDQGLGEPESGLAKAITFGMKNNLPLELTTQFSQTGVSHIMAISGMNITLLVAASLILLLHLGISRKIAFYFITLFLFLFIIFVGAPASALRAGVMGFLVLLAIKLGRLNKITHAIILSACLMLLFNPRLLRDDVGFQLSFLATLSLVYFYPFFSSWINERFYASKSIILKYLYETVAITLSAQILTLPIIIYNFGIISFIAPLANLFILWSVTPLMFLTICAVILGAFSLTLLKVILIPVWLILQYIIITVKLLSKFPGAYLKIAYLSLAWIIIYYLLIFFLMKYLKKRNIKERKR